EYCTLIYMLLALAAPFALFSSYATAHELRHYLSRSKSTHIFVHNNFLSVLLEAAHEEGFPVENIFILDGTTATGTKSKSLDGMIQEVRRKKLPKEPVRTAGKNSLAYLVLSSGTYGLPKTVRISHGCIFTSMFQAVIVMMELMKVKVRKI
ncbi:hypothetical protein M422DRAFT_182085, partial [Sphaerobolus stellatus SS14]